jgi:HTH-type transcriptional regulator/antitoxin HigA
MKLKSNVQYEWALASIEYYFDNPPALGTLGARRFDELACAIDEYENQHWKIEDEYDTTATTD